MFKDLHEGVAELFEETAWIHQVRIDAEYARRQDAKADARHAKAEAWRWRNWHKTVKAIRDWQKRHPEKMREYQRRRYARDEEFRQRKNAASRKWAAENRGKIAKRKAEKRAEKRASKPRRPVLPPEEKKRRKREWRLRNKERLRKLARAWDAANKERVAAQRKVRLAAKRAEARAAKEKAMGVKADMTAKDWFICGWFKAMECLREAPDDLPHINSLPRDKAFRQGFKAGVKAYEQFVESFMAPKGE